MSINQHYHTNPKHTLTIHCYGAHSGNSEKGKTVQRSKIPAFSEYVNTEQSHFTSGNEKEMKKRRVEVQPTSRNNDRARMVGAESRHQQTDTFQSEGKFNYPDGSVYEGQIQSGRPHGQGIRTYEDGSVYKGKWKNGYRHGKGMLTEKNGNFYDGQWKNGEHYGQGIMIFKDGKVYDGQWKNGRFHGHGLMNSQDGRYYEGNWKNGYRHGQGMMIFKDEKVYEGEWRNGYRHGRGKQTYNDGKALSGLWKVGKFVEEDLVLPRIPHFSAPQF